MPKGVGYDDKKMKSSTSKQFASGGKTKMSGMNYVGPQQPGQSASMGQKTDAPIAKAGGKAMASFSGAAPAKPGQVSSGGRSGNTSFSPDTGSGKMAGYTGSQPAKAC